MKKFTLIYFLFLIFVQQACAQANSSILPQSSLLPSRAFPPAPVVTLDPFSAEYLAKLDMDDFQNDRLPKITRAIAANINLHNAGNWTTLASGARVWQVQITAEGAQGLMPLFDSLYLPPGATLHVYMPGKQQILGAFTNANTPLLRVFNPGLINGESCVIEYYEPAAENGKGILSIEKVGYAYRWVPSLVKSADSGSGSCEVNVACSEGDNWSDQIRSVVRVFVVNDLGDAGLCSGSMINNARQDCTPYILSAGHCTDSGQVSPANFGFWIFYFNSQTSGCSGDECSYNDFVNGCTKVAYSDDQNGSNGSDFLLVKLNSIPPSGFNVYYSGWDNTNVPAQSGVDVHHPGGDCKKISTYDNAAVSSQWGTTILGTHWQVHWSQTTNGYGVTEPGSSGSPMYNQNGLIVGHLTGGSSCCASGACNGAGSPESPDYFGKIWFDWTFNGATPSYQLGPWLDPDNTGISTLQGMNPPCGDGLSDDAGIADITIPNGAICDNVFIPQVLLRNYGSNELTSVTIDYSFDGAPNSIHWTGSLAPGADQTFNIPGQNLAVGPHTAIIETKNPNGSADSNPSNDTATANFTVNPSSGAITLLLNTDGYGSQISWQITQNSAVVASGGPYINDDSGKLYTIPLCLPAECSVFTIFSSGDNGLTGGGVTGSFFITGSGGSPVYASLSSPDFGSQAVYNFCIAASGIEDVAPLNIAVFPNPSAGVFNLQFETGGEKNIKVTDITGRVILAKTFTGTNGTINLAAYSKGLYLLQVESDGKRAVKKLVLE